jgi:hypothetical protein
LLHQGFGGGVGLIGHGGGAWLDKQDVSISEIPKPTRFGGGNLFIKS